MAKRHRSTPAVVLFLFIAALSLLVGTAGAVPEANFTSNVISGAAPLTVEFNDTSTGSPTGWAWYFGDETYNSTPWTRVNASAWPARLGHTSVVMPNGSIVLMGGAVGETWQYYKDVWRSDDNGETWTRVIENAPWSARYYPSAVAMPDGSIVIMGGNDDSFRNDVWRSGDYGGTWTGVPAGAWWSARFMHTSVVLPNGSIILMGGWDNTGYKNDVWKSTDNGTTWTRVIENAPWSTRYEHTAVAMPDGSIVLMGGSDGSSKNDVWRSFNGGETWTRVIENAPWSARTGHTSVAMPDGSIVLMGGSSGSRSDVWRSTDNGTTWTEVTGGAEWSARLGHTSVVLHNGSILLMGGSTGGNEVWRLDTAGSNNQSPTYTYTTPGTYTVALQAYNDDGYNATRKIGYITVTAPAPTAAFTANRTSGTVPLAVQFNDTSTGGPTSWSWNFGDGATSIDQNATHTYAAAGTYNVSLTVSNAAGSNTYTGDNYITVSAAPVAPAAAFTANRTSGPAPLAVQFTDASTGGPAGWAWFFGDEKYDGAWTGANASAGWSARRGHSSVALPDGSIVLMGGDESFGNTKNDAWRSTDGGGNWTCVNASSGWTPRWNHAAVAMPDGSIILMGGDEGAGNMKNDTWRSTDNGTTWTCVNTSSGWTPRWKHAAVAMPDGSIILMGGDEGAGNMKNDTWRSTDGGGNWTRLPDAGWTPRWSHAAVALPDGSIVLMGGYGGAWLNDVWRLPYGETTWLCVNASSVWSARYGHTAVAMPDGSIVLMGGASTVLNNDAWRSTDGGGNWTCVNASSGWSRRYGHTAVAICRTGASYSWAGLTLPGT